MSQRLLDLKLIFLNYCPILVGSCGTVDRPTLQSTSTWGTMDLHLLLTGIQKRRTGLHLLAETQWLRYHDQGCCILVEKETSRCTQKRGGGGGVLPYIGCIGMCGTKGYGFSAALVISRVSILAI